MVNILIPACGNDQQFLDEFWPKNVTEIAGKTMMQHTIENFQSVINKRFIVLLNAKECSGFHTDNVVKLSTDGDAAVIRLDGITEGALCTCLTAIELINDDNELIISNNDQKFDCDMEELVNVFRTRKADCGVITFDCIHPRWSYVRIEEGYVTEASEKRPISRCAIAGVYYFKKGSEFVLAAMNAIRKGRSYKGQYYLSSAINEMVLMNKTVVNCQIDNQSYHTFYEPKQIEKYELETGK